MESGLLVDTRSIGKPKIFDGSADSWRDWSFQFQAWVTLLDGRFATALPAAADRADELKPETGDEQRKLSSNLYFILVMLCAGSALAEIRSVPVGQGLEAWRRLSRRFEPRTRNHILTMLTSVLSPNLGGNTAEEIRDHLILGKQIWIAMSARERPMAVPVV
jgi:hypothetical protein